MWKKLSSGASGNCYIKNNIVKKCYNEFFQKNVEDVIKKMCNEINALTLLRKYKYFPKIIKVDWKKYIIYMNYVGEKIRKFSKNTLPKNILFQLNQIKKALNKESIIHTDLNIRHFMLYKDTISLIDFEKVIIDKKMKTPYKKYDSTARNYTEKKRTMDVLIREIRHKFRI